MRLNPLLAILAIALIGLSLWHLRAAQVGVETTSIDLGGTPVHVFRPVGGRTGPVVVIAHGFAGSSQLMQSFALSFARNGYTAVTFDFPGHGRNAAALAGSITQIDGATRTLLVSLRQVASYARGLGDGRLAVLGHSMASDIVVRYAASTPDVAATIAVSMYSTAVTATSPRNLLVIVGGWETTLKREALLAVGLATSPATAMAGVTYGDVRTGTARRAAFSPHVEHASVLYSQASMREAVAWLDATFGTTRARPLQFDGRGPWILLLVAGVVLLGRPFVALLPRVVPGAVGAGLSWRRLCLPLLLPMIVTPLALRVMPTHFLPVLVGDYLAAHFALYGVLTALCMYSSRRRAVTPTAGAMVAGPRLWRATLLLCTFGFVGLVWPVDRYATSFVPGGGRLPLLLALLGGTLGYFLADEWLTRGTGAARGAYLASKVAFLVSLAAAVALDFERLFFLVIIVPVMVLFFVVHGLLSRWSYLHTGHPFVAGVANAIAFAWAIGVTFPLLAG